MSVGVLVCGVMPGTLGARHGSYAALMQRLLGPGRAVRMFDAMAGELPTAETACAAYLLTGSSAGVYDPLPWIAPLLAFLQTARGRAKLVGICFGHQAMAQAFGGRVEKSDRGWGIGLQRYAVVQAMPWMGAAPAFIDVPASHQDQVVAVPPGARVTIANAFTPFAGLDYGDAISFQFHPEFTPAFGRALVEERRGVYGALSDAALASYDQPNDCARVARWIGAFLDEAR